MRTIIEVLGCESWVSEASDGLAKEHARTYLIVQDDLGNTEEAVGYGLDYAIGDSVQVFFDDKHNMIKAIKNRV